MLYGYFKIPIKDGWVDVDLVSDNIFSLVVDGTDVGYVYLQYKTAKKNWQPITQEEFEAKRAEIMPPVVPEGTEAVSVGD